MSPELATVVDDGVEYCFAMEYDGPPITHHLPRAVPINVDRIPVATVVSQVPLSHKLTLPVVQPISATDITKRFSKDLKHSSESTVSPTSVIAFQRVDEDDSASKELALGSETTLSPSSVTALEERVHSNRASGLSGQSSSSSPLERCNGDESVGEFSGLINESTDLASSSISRDHSHELLGRVESSGTFRFSSSFEKSRDLSRSTHNLRASTGRKDRSSEFNDLSQPDWASNESILSLDYPSSRVSSHKYGDSFNETSCDVKRAPVVTFCDIESEDEDINEDVSGAEPEAVRPKKEPAVKVKKGVCYRCCKGNRFTEKEVCIVCNAKYCSNCVLRAMGSMPEGRKCVSCISYPIDESKRGNLGKCSRMLKRLLNDLEIRQIMKAEKMCEVNQLPSEYLCVNGRPLSPEELVILQSCINPPKKLKPGNYWYDKVSGLWGKEGQKPSQIITPHLNAGGPIKTNASNGNTQVYINGREITKSELRMLQLAGVQCAGNPHFWVNEDGSYQEEGQKNTKGYIWGKAKILYKDVPFSEDEREHIKLLIQSNVYGYIGVLLEGRERFEEESLHDLRAGSSSCDSGLTGDKTGIEKKTLYSIPPRLKAFSDWLLKIMATGNLEAVFPAATREYAPLIEELWNNAAIQATYKRRSELEMLHDMSCYFLERAVDILKTDYEPSDVDILYAEGVTSSNGLSCVDFSFPDSEDYNNLDSSEHPNSMLRFQLIRVQARGFIENCKWIEMFEDVRVVIFCVALSDYDEYVVDEIGEKANKMLLTKKLFESIVTHPTFDQMDFLVILNKFDLFEEKLERVPLTKCEWFDDFHPIVSRHRSNCNSSSINHSPSVGQLAFHHVAVKFKRLFSALTNRKLYVSLVKGLEPKTVDESLKYAREIIKWDEERLNFSLSEYSFYSTDASSFSP